MKTKDLVYVGIIAYLAYLLIMLAMVQTVWTYNLVKNDNEKLAVKLELLGRWFFPILFVGFSFYFILKKATEPLFIKSNNKDQRLSDFFFKATAIINI